MVPNPTLPIRLMRGGVVVVVVLIVIVLFIIIGTFILLVIVIVVVDYEKFELKRKIVVVIGGLWVLNRNGTLLRFPQTEVNKVTDWFTRIRAVIVNDT